MGGELTLTRYPAIPHLSTWYQMGMKAVSTHVIRVSSTGLVGWVVMHAGADTGGRCHFWEVLAKRRVSVGKKRMQGVQCTGELAGGRVLA